MKSPFAIFRKHQKQMTVILTGLAMFAFVILGAVNDPANMPVGLIVIFVACALGAIGWIAGIRSKKSNEFGLVGMILGAVLAIAGTMAGGPQAVVKADSGDIDQLEFEFLRHKRMAANQVIERATQLVRQKDQTQFLRQPAPFGYHPDPRKDIVIGELLRREADEMGLEVTDNTVNDYLASITQQKLTREDVKQIRDAMKLSESDMYGILKDEIKARLAAQYMYKGTTLTPESYWDFYRQLNVRQSLSIVPLSVSMFVADSPEPSEAELQELFDTHRENFPDTSDDRQLEEGRPGFRQPRRVQLAYVEAAYDDIEQTVTPPTDEEIEDFYNEHYKTIPVGEFDGESAGPGDEASPPMADGPALPAAGEGPPDGKVDGDDLPPGENDLPSGENDLPPGDDGPKPEEADASEEGAALSRSSQTHFVALFDDEEPAVTEETSEALDAEVTADAETTDDDTTDEAPSPEASSSDELSASPDTSAADSDQPPPPPLPQTGDSSDSAPGLPSAPEVRELDDDLRGEISDQILRQRTGEKLKEVIDEAITFMRDLEIQLTYLPEDEGYLTQDEARERLKAYAEQHGLVYSETPPLSALELRDSEEYPIGKAVDRLFSDPFSGKPVTDVVSHAFASRPDEVFRSTSVVQPETDSRFAYWKTDDQDEYVPKSLSDPGIREQVIAEWRELKAREAAQQRATALVQLVEGSEALLSEVLAGQTLTGADDAPSVSVLHPQSFSWLSKADPRLSPNPWSTPAPERTRLRNVPGRIGNSFMETVFDDLKTGEVGVAHSLDKKYFYVVKVDERTYGSAEDLATFRERFMSEQLFAPYQFSDYPKLAQSELQQYQTDWSKALFEKHGVEIIEEEEEEPEAEGELAGQTTNSSYY